MFLGVLIAAAVGIGVWWYPRAPARTAWQGYAEADYVKVGPTQQGLLTEVNIARGAKVDVGTLLFSQDETADRAARDQAARQLQQARDQLANLEAAGKPTEIEQAEANLADARATVERTKVDLDRAETLIKNGAVTVQTLDQRRADFRSATARVAAMEAALDQARAPMGRQGRNQGAACSGRSRTGRGRDGGLAPVAASGDVARRSQGRRRSGASG